jgi:RHS repeat-associated protein
MRFTQRTLTFDPNDVPVATESMRYLEGFGLPAQQTVSSAETRYFHGDLVRSTNLLTEGNGAAVATSAYTAFGELVGGDLDTRYRYAGGWGYESDLLVLEGAPGSVPITLMHAGARWYQPDIGRFIQRDPLGIFGGLNVYVYAVNDPVTLVDPHGLYPGDDAPPWPPGDREGRKAMRHFIRRWLRRWGLGGGMGTGVGAVLGKRKAKQLPLGGSQSSSVVVERIRMTLRLSSSGRVVYVLRIGARAVGWVGFAVDACVLASDLYRDMTDPGWDADPDDW